MFRQFVTACLLSIGIPLAQARSQVAFVKVDAFGNDLSATAASWTCVRDTVSGLWFEVKTNNGGLRDGGRLFTNYNPHDGSVNWFQMLDPSNTLGYVRTINDQGLCGKKDWRLPTTDEFAKIGSSRNINYKTDPVTPWLYSSWFPNTSLRSKYWTPAPPTLVPAGGSKIAAQTMSAYDGRLGGGKVASDRAAALLVRSNTRPSGVRYVPSVFGRFVKLDAYRTVLPDAWPSWAAVKDVATGLIWEIKTSDGGPRDKAKRYTNYDNVSMPQAGTYPGNCRRPTSAELAASGNAQGYVTYVNGLATPMLRKTNWRLPTTDEMYGLMDMGPRRNGNDGEKSRMDLRLFPETQRTYWTSTDQGVQQGCDLGQFLLTVFANHPLYVSDRSHQAAVRLVANDTPDLPMVPFDPCDASQIQPRLDVTDTPFGIYRGCPSLLPQLYGKTYQGGKIAHFDTTTGAGFVVSAKIGSPAGLPWQDPSCASYTVIDSATAQGIGSGSVNTPAIIKAMKLCAPTSTGNYAALAASTASFGGFGDWVLPGIDELQVIAKNIPAEINGCPSTGPLCGYWASSESRGTPGYAYFLVADRIGAVTENGKLAALGVRAIRYFDSPPPASRFSSFSPASARVGDTITIDGLNFTTSSRVEFSTASAAASVVFVSATTLKAVVPAGAVRGPITVTTNGISSTSANAFVVTPVIQSVPPAGVENYAIVIRGTGFNPSAGANQVFFKGVSTPVAAMSATPTSVSVVIPIGAVWGKVVVRTDGTPSDSSADRLSVLTYATPVTIPNGGFRSAAVTSTSPTTVVAVGDGGLIYSSTDGGTGWASRTSGVTQHLHSVTYCGSPLRFRAWGDQTLLTSTDGASWSRETVSADIVASVCQPGTSSQTILGYDAKTSSISTSTDAKTWTSVGAANHVSQLAWNGTVMAATSENPSGADSVYWSSTPLTGGWSSTSINVSLSAISARTTAPKNFVIIGRTGLPRYGSDGAHWTAATCISGGCPGQGSATNGAVAWNSAPGYFLASVQGMFLVSRDGSDWSPLLSDHILSTAIVPSGRGFVAVGDGGIIRFTERTP